MLILLVNLERAPERLLEMREEYARAELDFERLDAVDAKKFKSEVIQKQRQPVSDRQYWLMDMSDGEIACYLSHKKAWEQLLESDEEWAYVAEDDARFIHDAKRLFADLSWIPEGTGIVQMSAYFENRPIKYQGTPVQIDSTFKLVKAMEYRLSGGGTQGYLINREMATRLLEEFPFINAPIDDMLFYHASPVREMTNVLFLCPPISITVDENESFLQADKAKMKSRFREYPLRYIKRKLIKWKHAFKCKFVYKDMIR